ncbi:response regulator [Pseudochrobactrum asaccharolyticum]|uniref:Flagellar transcriptional regulator FtcR n=1 Tax=Pseudochrobactrum asaccharolyticum TaxID=354351 RepID=A0A366DPK7_9HYPH|nr:response regulator [Pseudochrobactrum asaccharolyticum]RBO91214.1 winged helix family two component transcriptional regulator [Pseudochrobactrum asaccharolyticum]
MTNALILIIEDEPEIADILRRYFEREGFRTVSAGDGETGLSHHLRLKPDLVVLDVKLPRQDGFEVLSALRQRGDTPVIMVTALAQDIDKLQALRSGADDYVVKPFNPLEVVARAKVVLRRSGHNRKSVMRVGALLIDMDAHTAIAEVSHQRRNLDLTRTEFRLLAHMAQWPNRVFERGELVDACLPEGDAVDRTVDSHISKLRRKLHEAGVDNQLTGVRGVGYRLEDRFV